MKKLLFLLPFLYSVVFAQDNIITDRPSDAASALVVPAKSFQVESGMTYTAGANTLTVPEYLFRVGVFKFLELRFDNVLYQSWTVEEFNVGDFSFGLKAQLLRKEKFKLAFLSHVTFLEDERSEVRFYEKLLLSSTLSDNSEILLNVGVANLGGSEGYFTYSILYSKSLKNNFGFFIEGFGSIDNGEFFSNIDVGASCLLKPRIQLDAKIGTTLGYFENYFFGVGISFRAFN